MKVKEIGEVNKPVPALVVEDWGKTEYQAAFEKQKQYVKERIADTRPDTLIFTEHEPVFTMGVRKGAESNLIWDEAILTEKGISLFKSNRGGDITYHGPGQLTGYPILDLAKLRDLHVYLSLIEDMLIRIVGQFDLKAGRREGKTGIWIEKRKVAAIGVAVKSWVSYHGFALNVNNDLEPFSGIVPCGIVDGTVTSLQNEIDQPLHIEDVKPVVKSSFLETFQEYLG